MENAIGFAKKGWKLFPAIWKETHQPLIKWSTESTSDIDTIKKWKNKWPDCYFCVALKQSDLIVIDVDDKNDKNGSYKLFDLQLEHGALPETLKIATPSGGLHFYFKGNGISRGVNKLGKGIDLPGMVPLPRTNIKAKGAYTIIENKPLAELPEWVYKIAGKKIEKRCAPEQNIKIEVDTEQNIDKATHYLTSGGVPFSIEGDKGDATAYYVACRVRDYGISEETCLDLMLEYWNDACEPPWDFEELKVKISNAYTYAIDHIGNKTAQYEFNQEITSLSSSKTTSNCNDYNLDNQQSTSSFTSEQESSKTSNSNECSVSEQPKEKIWKRYKDYKLHPVPKRKWIIENWIPEGKIISLYGKGGLGKSLLAMQLGCSIATKTPFLELPVEKHMPVVFVSCEDDDDEMYRRMHRIENSPEYSFCDKQLLEENMILMSRVGEEATLARAIQNKVITGQFYTMLRDSLAQIGDMPKFIIFDTIADVFAGSENDRTSVNQFIKHILGQISKETKSTILMVGHPSKNSNFDYSGSTAWDNGVRGRLTLMPHENENLDDFRILINSKSNFPKAKGGKITTEISKGRYVRVEENSIIDQKEEEDLNILQTLIVDQAKVNIPVGKHHNSRANLYDIVIKDSNGEPMSKETKRRLITKLIMEGHVKEVKGKRDDNGYWPA